MPIHFDFDDTSSVVSEDSTDIVNGAMNHHFRDHDGSKEQASSASGNGRPIIEFSQPPFGSDDHDLVAEFESDDEMDDQAVDEAMIQVMTYNRLMLNRRQAVKIYFRKLESVFCYLYKVDCFAKMLRHTHTLFYMVYNGEILSTKAAMKKMAAACPDLPVVKCMNFTHLFWKVDGEMVSLNDSVPNNVRMLKARVDESKLPDIPDFDDQNPNPLANLRVTTTRVKPRKNRTADEYVGTASASASTSSQQQQQQSRYPTSQRRLAVLQKRLYGDRNDDEDDESSSSSDDEEEQHEEDAQPQKRRRVVRRHPVQQQQQQAHNPVLESLLEQIHPNPMVERVRQQVQQDQIVGQQHEEQRIRQLRLPRQQHQQQEQQQVSDPEPPQQPLQLILQKPATVMLKMTVKYMGEKQEKRRLEVLQTETFESLVQKITAFCGMTQVAPATGPVVMYKDDEGEDITCSTDEEWRLAVKQATAQQKHDIACTIYWPTKCPHFVPASSQQQQPIYNIL